MELSLRNRVISISKELRDGLRYNFSMLVNTQVSTYCTGGSQQELSKQFMLTFVAGYTVISSTHTIFSKVEVRAHATFWRARRAVTRIAERRRKINLKTQKHHQLHIHAHSHAAMGPATSKSSSRKRRTRNARLVDSTKKKQRTEPTRRSQRSVKSYVPPPETSAADIPKCLRSFNKPPENRHRVESRKEYEQQRELNVLSTEQREAAVIPVRVGARGEQSASEEVRVIDDTTTMHSDLRDKEEGTEEEVDLSAALNSVCEPYDTSSVTLSWVGYTIFASICAATALLVLLSLRKSNHQQLSSFYYNTGATLEGWMEQAAVSVVRQQKQCTDVLSNMQQQHGHMFSTQSLLSSTKSSLQQGKLWVEQVAVAIYDAAVATFRADNDDGADAGPDSSFLVMTSGKKDTPVMLPPMYE